MGEPHITYDADRPPTATDALAIIEREQARAGSVTMPNLVVLHGGWGLTWLLSGIAHFLFLTGSLNGRVTGIAIAVLVLAMAGASVVTGVRSGRGIRSTSQLQGALYGISWTIAMSGMGFLVGGVGALGIPDRIAAALFPALFVFVAGALYLAAGAVWSNIPQYILGAWTIAVAVASVYVGAPGSALVLGIGGGSGFLVAAAWFATKGRPR